MKLSDHYGLEFLDYDLFFLGKKKRFMMVNNHLFSETHGMVWEYILLIFCLYFL